MLVCVQGGRRRGVQEGQVPPDFADVEKGTEALNIQPISSDPPRFFDLPPPLVCLY